jgi:anti-sigma B factor antagonist
MTQGDSAAMTESASTLVITPTDSGFAVEGEIDAHSAPTIAAAIAESSVDPLHIDLSGVEFVDSSGLRVLIEAHQTRQAAGQSMTLVRPSHVVSRLFEIAGVGEYLDIAAADGVE